MDLNGDGEILVLPTPGHTLAHVSVLVQGEPAIFLAGDASYSVAQLKEDKVDGIMPSAKLYRETAEKIRALAREQAMIYLPSHDPEGEVRLKSGVTQ
jgi:N-acyl homoserine lactone hydrolase